jgi:hypothetical protein
MTPNWRALLFIAATAACWTWFFLAALDVATMAR